MYQSNRLSYIVPGYTGHIPQKKLDDCYNYEKERPRNQIPGYAGYIKGIKSENIHAGTYGKITYNISCQNYTKGQDLDSQNKYISTKKDAYINPIEMKNKTFSNILGVIEPPKVITQTMRRNLMQAKKQPIPLDVELTFWGVQKYKE